MKVLVPLNNKDYMEKLVDAGADELYLGFYDKEWFRIFGEYADINRMSGFRQNANRYDFSEMIALAKSIKDKGAAAFVTMNANCYSAAQVEYVTEHYFPAMKEAGINGIIVSDLPLARAAHEAGLATVASTMCAIYNKDIATCWYETGMRRFILPRDLSLDEISSICEAYPDVEYEVFFMRNGCIFSDCYCLGMHRKECGSTCGFLRNCGKQIVTEHTDFHAKQQIDTNDYFYNKHFHHDACGMCALYRMKEIGISALKVVGRADRCDSVCEDIRLAKRNIAIAEAASSEEEYLNRMEYPVRAGQKCMWGFSCYYPEVRFPKKH
ncbi:MAG: U32 family peptidase [Eubacteriales bacterium]|nr:U32 family peptidase [Eubacteriales bacterium]